MKREKIIKKGHECIKYGKNNRGQQKYMSKVDGSIITEGVKEKPTEEQKLLAVFLYQKGLTISKIAEIVGACDTSVVNWLNLFNNEIKNTHQISDIKSVKDVEIDEFHSIDKTVGYFNDTFPDMSKIEIDICPACLKEKLGDNLRITPYNS